MTNSSVVQQNSGIFSASKPKGSLGSLLHYGYRMFYDNYRLNNKSYTLANMDFNHIRIERMLHMAEKRLRFFFKDLVVEGHDWPGAIHVANYEKLKAAYETARTYDIDLEDELQHIDGYVILKDEDSIVALLNAYLSVGAGQEVRLHDVSPNKVIRFDLSH